ncbi:MAG: hypothetical protein ACPGYT_07440 [Nitrospirales bacterium]
MTLFPMTKASIGLSLSRDSLCLVEIKRRWGGIHCRHIAGQQLPPNTLRLSPAKLNIENPEEFNRCIRDLLRDLTPPRGIALSLPDLCGRTTVLTFTSFPTQKTEQDSIVRWRFQQDMNVSTDNSRFAYSILKPSTQPGEPTHVLATAVQHNIIEQYEQACLEVGLLPNSVGLAGLDIFDFYRSHVQEISGGSKQQRSNTSQECLFLYLADWGFSFMAFRQGCPTFVRVKALPISRLQYADDRSEEAQDSSLFNPEHSDKKPLTPPTANEQYSVADTTKVSNEIVATLQYYFETLQHAREEDYRIPLYFAEGLRLGETLLPTEQVIQEALQLSMPHPPLLTMQRFSDKMSRKMKQAILNSEPQMASASALASVMVVS